MYGRSLEERTGTTIAPDPNLLDKIKAVWPDPQKVVEVAMYEIDRHTILGVGHRQELLVDVAILAGEQTHGANQDPFNFCSYFQNGILKQA